MVNETQKAIHNAFIKLYEEKPYDKINIKELCATASVARTTFYSYYANISDLKNEIENELILGIVGIADDMSQNHTVLVDLKEYFLNVFQYIKNNWDYNYVFLVKQPNFYYMDKWKSALKKHFKMRFDNKISLPNYDAILEVGASSVISLYCYWMQNPEKSDLEQMIDIGISLLNYLLK